MARPNFISEEDVARWSEHIDDDERILKIFKENKIIREVMYAGLWLNDELTKRGCANESIVEMQFRAGKLSFGREPWEVHQKILHEFDRLNPDYKKSASEMN